MESKNIKIQIKESEIKNMENAYKKFALNNEIFEDKHLFSCEQSVEFIKEIRLNYTNIIENEELLKNTYDKITTKNKMIRDILTYEFLFYKPSDDEKINDLTELIKFAKSEIGKYQGIIGGYNLEDNEWVQCGDRFSLKYNQIGIFNTCCESEQLHDKDQIWFIKNFVTRIKKFCGDKLTADYKMFEDEENEICWLILVFEDKSIKEKNKTDSNSDLENC